VGLIDETSFRKKGDKTPGVKRQYCGSIGKQDNCMVTVHLGYAADQFHCLLDGELFLPQDWSADRQRCREAGIPDEIVYRPKTEIALELYDRAWANGVRFAWMTFDEWYGAKPAFLRGLRERRQCFVGEVPKNFLGWIDPPAVTSRPYRRGGRGRGRRTPRLRSDSRPAQTVEYWLKHHPRLRRQAWKRWRLRDGEKGPMVWETKHVRFFPL
jgi:SRSO17 transposase